MSETISLTGTRPAESRPRAGRRRSVITPAQLDLLSRRVVHAGGGRAGIPVIIPFTGERLGTIPRCTADDVAEALRRAREVQPAWAATPFRERARIFLRFHDLLLDRRDEVLDLIQLESGKTRRDAFEEVADTAVVARYYAYHAERHLRPQRRRGALPLLTTAWEFHHPVGVAGFIVPWNYPLNLTATDAIAALMAGNAAVLKPDHQTSFTALWMAELLREAGLPPHVFPVVTGQGPELGPPLLEGVNFIMFTGSTATGKIIARQAAERLIGYSLELGGKNPMLVLADADVERAVQGAVRGCFVGAGQVCVSTERLYIHDTVWDAFVERFTRRTRELRLGAGLDFRAEMGSLASAKQLRRVGEHVDDAVAKGATVLTGGRPRPDVGPFFYEPTLLTGVTPEMKLFGEETFGPVASLYRFEAIDDAVQCANDTRYGLSASVWTRDLRKGREVAQRIQAGMVSVNDAYAAAWASADAPIGGFKESGSGRRHGREGIVKYTEPQTVALQRGFSIVDPPGLRGAAFARAMGTALKVMRHLPGLR